MKIAPIYTLSMKNSDLPAMQKNPSPSNGDVTNGVGFWGSVGDINAVTRPVLQTPEASLHKGG